MIGKCDSTRFRTTISGLLFRCRPSAIARGIMSIVINPINRMFGRRSRSNICKKLVKVFVENFNTSTTPVLKVSGVRIIAPRSQRIPYHSLRMFLCVYLVSNVLCLFTRLVVGSPTTFALGEQSIRVGLVFTEETFTQQLFTFRTLLHTNLYTQCMGGLT